MKLFLHLFQSPIFIFHLNFINLKVIAKYFDDKYFIIFNKSLFICLIIRYSNSIINSFNLLFKQAENLLCEATNVISLELIV